jgi:S-layer homology domain.
MNRTRARKSMAVLIITLLITGLAPGMAYANNKSGVPASSLSVSLTENGATSLLHDYTAVEMTNMIDGRNIKYSSIDAMPARVLTVANGVYLSTLIEDLSKYTKIDITNFEKIRLTATDGWTRTFTNNDVYKKQYYYGKLFNAESWDSSTGKAGSSAEAGAKEVKPMLAVTSWQGRVMENTSDVSALIGEMSGETMFRLCVGMSPSDLTSGDSTTSEYGKWISQIEILLSENAKPQSKWKNNYTDVSEKNWFYSAVQFACSKDLFQGTSADTFSPDAAMTRAMFVTVLGRMAKANTADYRSDFTDVAQGQYYAGYVAWAAENGIASGSGSGMFRPDDRITREQMALILYRYAKLIGKDVADTSRTKCLSYFDFEDVADTAKDAVCWAVNTGIMAGNSGIINPRGEATRAQVAQIMKNFAEIEELQ